MPDSITLNLPSWRRVLRVLAGLVGFVALLLIGLAIGSRLLATNPINGLAAPGVVQQVRVLGGTVYVGRMTSSDGEFVRIAEPATIRQSNAGPSASPGPQLTIDALGVEPYDIGGDLVIPVSSIEFVSTVRSGSGLETAYRQATGAGPATPAPSASP